MQLPHMDHGRRSGHVQFAEFRGQYLSMRVAASEPRGGRGESLTTWPEAKQNELSNDVPGTPMHDTKQEAERRASAVAVSALAL